MTDRIDDGHPAGNREAWVDEDEAQEDIFKPLTKQEAAALRARHPPVSPWLAVAAQAGVGLCASGLVWGLTRNTGWAWSTLYGAAAVVVPGAVMARGMKRTIGLQPGAALSQFMVWELVKMVVAVAMLFAAPKVVPGLSWLALLLTMILCLKVNWLVLILGQRRSVRSQVL